jgi:hypothetical protein
MRDLIHAFVGGIAGAVTVVVLIGATSIKTDGNVETDQQLISNVPPGTPPLAVQSSHVVANLNADTVDGMEANAFALASDTYTIAEVDALLAASRDTRRAFYLTIAEYDGGEPAGSDGNGAGVCAAGFHFANAFELVDIGFLRYATDSEGGGDVRRSDDSGAGPPTTSHGWVRTGYSSDIGALLRFGRSNCLAWTSGLAERFGTVLAPSASFWVEEYGWAQRLMPWSASTTECNEMAPVWCVEDYPGAAS